MGTSTISTGPFSIANCWSLPEGKSCFPEKLDEFFLRKVEPAGKSEYLLNLRSHPVVYLVGGLNPSEKYEFVNGKDDSPSIMENKIHVPNHEPDILLLIIIKHY